MKILLVNNINEDLEYFEETIKNFNITLDKESNPLNVINTIKINTYDLIIIDFEISGINGFTLLKEIKTYDKSIQVIIITDNGDLYTAKECLNNSC